MVQDSTREHQHQRPDLQCVSHQQCHRRPSGMTCSTTAATPIAMPPRLEWPVCRCCGCPQTELHNHPQPHTSWSTHTTRRVRQKKSSSSFSNWLLVVAFLAFFIMLPCTSTANKPTDLSQRLSRSHFEFSLSLYKQLVRQNEAPNNLVFSPYSVNAVLSMLFLGTSSASSSSSQLRSVLHYDNISYVDVHTAFKSISELFGDKYYAKKVHSANGLFVQEGVAISPPYERALREFYGGATVEHLDFRNADPGQTMGVVNDWVRDVTEGSIPRLLDAPPSKENRMMLVNAMAMDARWLNPFDPNDTFDKGLFFPPGKDRMEVPMMFGRFTLPLGHSPELECRVLELPFTQKRISMFILLPDDPDNGLDILEKNMTTENIKMLFSTLEDEEVNVRIPRFEVRSEADIADALINLGVTDIFDASKSDLHLMAPDANLHLNSIAHKAVFEVTEDGARGSAATVASLDRLSSTIGQKYFEVDHPFLFLVWDYYSGMLLLMGKVVEPEIIAAKRLRK